ncbi:MAG: hypothetical protein E7556_04130, partial [Ruminococcaceae bacterium]|nr:hypothetical protein [Oscillospiraceae bacterium]
MKKVLSLILAFVFVMGVCISAPITANAASVDDLKFELNEDGKSYSVSAENLRMEGDLVIPSEYNGLPVTEIARTGFQFCSLLKSVKFPETLKKINLAAFDNCARISEVTIPASVEFIDGAVFSSIYDLSEIKVASGNKYYKSVDGVLYNMDMTELLDYPPAKEGSTYTLPETVTKVAGWCFSNNRYLVTIEFNNNIKTIDEGTFAYCRSLENVTSINKVTTFGVNSFRGCNKINYITFPNTLKIIEQFAFGDCLNLTAVKFNGSESQWKSVSIDSRGNDYLLNANVEFVPESESHIHNYTSEITEYPTCTITGVKTFTCSCGSSYKETIEALGHKWNDGSITMHPTCTTSGEKTFVCKVCYTSKSELISATGHKETIVGKKDATENEVGYTGDKVCSVCNKVIEKGEEIPKLSTTLATPVVTVKNSATGVKVTWKAIDGATSYKVYRKSYSTKTKKYGSWKTCGTVTATSYVDTKAKSGTKYIYTVKALNGDVKSGIKSSSSILYLSQPTVKIANASTGVKVTWNKITGATGYKVYRAEYKNGKWSSWKGMKTIDKGSTVSYTDKSA